MSGSLETRCNKLNEYEIEGMFGDFSSIGAALVFVLSKAASKSLSNNLQEPSEKYFGTCSSERKQRQHPKMLCYCDPENEAYRAI